MKNKIFALVLIILIYLIFSAISVQAVGLSSRNSIVKKTDFIPNTQQTFAYMLRTTVDFTQDYELIAQGDLAHLITFEPGPILKNISPGQDPWFNVIINFPALEGDITPGLHDIRIGVLEGSSGGGQIGGRTAVSTKIVVRILYPGKYLKANLNAPNVNINELAKMSVNLENWGKQDDK